MYCNSIVLVVELSVVNAKEEWLVKCSFSREQPER